MPNQILWSVVKKGTVQTRLDLPPFWTFFYWLRERQLIEAGDFGARELKIEVQSYRRDGEDPVPFEQTLKALKK